MGTLNYLKNLIADKNVASVTPTSSFGVERICRKIDFDRARVVVEYGPGGGVFTRRLLELMRPDARLIALETNSNFVERLMEQIHDPRLTVLNESAEDVLSILARFNLNHADYIISGIPFSLFTVQLKDKILQATNTGLAHDGKFFVYQFLLSVSASRHDIKRKLKQHMRMLDSEVEFRCVPPLRIYEVGKAG